MKTRHALLFACALMACTSTGIAPSEGALPADADAAADACPSGSHAAPSGCEATLAVAPSRAPLHSVRDHHTTFVTSAGGAAFLYVIGGTDSWTTIYDDVLRARIAPDGSLGAFESIGKLPEPRAGHTAVVVGRRVVVSGGQTATPDGRTMSTLASTLVATIADDGSLGPWTSAPPLPLAVMHHSCDAVSGAILCIGGRIDGNFTGDLAVRIPVSDDGTLGAPQPFPKLAQTIGFHQAFVHDGALFVAGGLHRDAPMPDFDRLKAVWRIPLAVDGSAAGTWESAGALPSVRYVASAQTFLDRVYFFGGQDENDDPLDTILSASIAPDGRIGDARVLAAKLSAARMHVHQTPMFDRFVYSVGGRDGNGASLGIVDIGRFE